MNTTKFPKLRLFLAGTFAFIWWFLFYPELCFSEDTYVVAYQGETYDAATWQKVYADKMQNVEGVEPIEMSEEFCEQLLQADEEQIIVKSRLLEFWQQSKN
ncbi:MAG: hypothetical protein J6B68_12405 [Lachnospiraceae bacterium]|nr:hypothetical protein [Lachnospiraceae bacterium]